MTTCIVCNKDVDEYKIQISIGGFGPPHQKGDAITTVCPSCGVMRLVGSELDYVKGIYEKPTKEQLDSLDVDQIINEMVLPNKYVGETLKWMDADIDDFGLDSLYQLEFSKGYNNYGKYNRLIHFLLIDKETRKENFGSLRCPSIMIVAGAERPGLLFKEGRRRFHLLRFLGATRIPVSIDSASLLLVKDSNIELYDSKE